MPDRVVCGRGLHVRYRPYRHPKDGRHVGGKQVIAYLGGGLRRLDEHARPSLLFMRDAAIALRVERGVYMVVRSITALPAARL